VNSLQIKEPQQILGSSGASMVKPRSVDKDAKLKEACREMESVFLNILLQQMRRTVPKEGLLEQSSGEETMQSMLDSEVTKNMAKAGGMGLADMLYRQLAERTNMTNKGQAP